VISAAALSRMPLICCSVSVAELCEFAFEFFHAGHGLGGGVVGLVAVGACGVAFGFCVAAALDLFGEAGLCGGDALVGAGARGVHLGLGGFDVADFAQLGYGAGEGIGVLPGDLLQGGDEFGGAGDAERDGLPAGLLGPLTLGFTNSSAESAGQAAAQWSAPTGAFTAEGS
jgi:hypothetical protein